MFDAAAGTILAAVQHPTAGHGLNGSLRNEWPTIRRLCKDVMVCLDSHGQHTLAARIEHEYQQLKTTWLAATGADDERARHRVLDAAEGPRGWQLRAGLFCHPEALEMNHGKELESRLQKTRSDW